MELVTGEQVKHHPWMDAGSGCRSRGITLNCLCGWHPRHVYQTKTAAMLDFGRHLLDPSYGTAPGEQCR